MLDKVQITINANNFKRLDELHEKWRKESPTMAEQDLNFVISRLLNMQ